MNDPGTSSSPPSPPRRLVFRPQPRSTRAITTTAATRTAQPRPRTATESTATATTTTTTTAEEDVADADATHCLGVIVMLQGMGTKCGCLFESNQNIHPTSDPGRV
mmetsp:Transcript_4514/g.5163  ORF Transcript_4514/g.5163 Transcript_4514/m.5163 type:complete len:106 (+) Transcript_4514:122-439(+)